jgi:drug/metabolite transporter (DMT)-like permease
MAYLFFNEIPVVTTYIGATIIIAATIYITNRERLAKN